MNRAAHRVRLLIAAAFIATPTLLSGQDNSCDDPASVEVRHLSITGNKTFSGSALKDGIVVEATPFLRRLTTLSAFGDTRCTDTTSLAQDSIRLAFFYKRSGFQSVVVGKKVTPTGTRRVKVEFTIHEGEPTIVNSLQFTGVDSIPNHGWLLGGLPFREGHRFDQYALRLTIDTLKRRMHDNGYPGADVLESDTSANRQAFVTLNIEPGRRAVIGPIDIVVRPRDSTSQQISNETVRGLVGTKPGDLFRTRNLERANRNLYFTQDYRSVLVTVDSSSVQPPGDSVVPVHVALTEGLTHAARAGGGWGTLDCFRADGTVNDFNVLHTAWRGDYNLRLSKIGIGRPLAGATSLCPELRNDPYSTTLNYFWGTTFTAPTPVKFGMRPAISVYGETRSEFNAYLRETPIGTILSATRTSSNRRVQTLSYQIELGRTNAQPAIFCALQNLCLPEDRDPLLAQRLVATAGWAVSQDWSNDPQNPSAGGVGKFEIRHASTAIGSDSRIQFSRGTVDVSTYFGLPKGVVFSPRIRVGAVVGPSFTGTSKFIPAQERLFAGGGNTVRGFNQNDLGPKVYITSVFDTVLARGGTQVHADDILPSDTVFFRAPPGISPQRSVPTGGSALVVANLELRVPSHWLPELFQFSFFTDAGELWSPGASQPEDRFRGIKITPGVGLRIATPIGAFRIDIAYNPYAPRAGAAFFDTPVTAGGLGGQLYCVSPGNTLAVTGLKVPGQEPVQAIGTCVRDFQPPSRRGFFNRLTLQFGIGQAY